MLDLNNTHWDPKDIESSPHYAKIKSFLECEDMMEKERLGLDLLAEKQSPVSSVLFEDLFNDFYLYVRFDRENPFLKYSKLYLEAIHASALTELNQPSFDSRGNKHANHKSALNILKYLAKNSDLKILIDFAENNKDQYDLFLSAVEVISNLEIPENELKRKLLSLVQFDLINDDSPLVHAGIGLLVKLQTEESLAILEDVLKKGKISYLSKFELLNSLISSENNNFQNHFIAFIPEFISIYHSDPENYVLHLDRFESLYQTTKVGKEELVEYLNSDKDSYLKEKLIDNLIWLVEDFKLVNMLPVLRELLWNESIDQKWKLNAYKKILKSFHVLDLLKPELTLFLNHLEQKVIPLEEQSYKRYELEDFIEESKEMIAFKEGSEWIDYFKVWRTS